MRGKERIDVVDEQGIQILGDLLLVREVQSSVKGYPDTFKVHRSNLDDVADLFTLEYPIPSAAGHVCYIQQLCAVDKAIVFASCDANTFDLHLEAHCSFIFPHGSGQLRFVVWRGDLPSRVLRMGGIVT